MSVNTFIGRPSGSPNAGLPEPDFDSFGTENVSLTETGRTKICLLKFEPCRQAIKENQQLYEDCDDAFDIHKIFLPSVAKVLADGARTCDDDPPLDARSGVVVQMNVNAQWSDIVRPTFDDVPVYFIEEFEKGLAAELNMDPTLVHVTSVIDVDATVRASRRDDAHALVQT
jgi:hypothetical protein